MAKETSLAPVKASELIANELRRRIARGELTEGDALPNETQLMEMHDASRPTVRGALRILESESLISVKQGPGGGARVRLPDVRVTARQVAMHLQLADATLRDLFEARSLLEPAAARRLAEQRPKRALRALRELHTREIALIGDPVAYPEAAARFHEQLIELAGNKTLSLIGRLLLEMVEAHNRELFARLPRSVRYAHLGSEAHAELLDLLEAGRADDAERFWRRHIEDGARVALRSLGARTVISIFNGERLVDETKSDCC